MFLDTVILQLCSRAVGVLFVERTSYSDDMNKLVLGGIQMTTTEPRWKVRQARCQTKTVAASEKCKKFLERWLFFPSSQVAVSPAATFCQSVLFPFRTNQASLSDVLSFLNHDKALIKFATPTNDLFCRCFFLLRKPCSFSWLLLLPIENWNFKFGQNWQQIWNHSLIWSLSGPCKEAEHVRLVFGTKPVWCYLFIYFAFKVLPNCVVLIKSPENI